MDEVDLVWLRRRAQDVDVDGPELRRRLNMRAAFVEAGNQVKAKHVDSCSLNLLNTGVTGVRESEGVIGIDRRNVSEVGVVRTRVSDRRQTANIARRADHLSGDGNDRAVVFEAVGLGDLFMLRADLDPGASLNQVSVFSLEFKLGEREVIQSQQFDTSCMHGGELAEHVGEDELASLQAAVAHARRSLHLASCHVMVEDLDARYAGIVIVRTAINRPQCEL